MYGKQTKKIIASIEEEIKRYEQDDNTALNSQTYTLNNIYSDTLKSIMLELAEISSEVLKNDCDNRIRFVEV